MSGAAPGTRHAAFLDRDGVINVDHGYVYRWQDFEFLPGVIPAMKQLHDAGYVLVVVTNQSGIARGMYTEAEFNELSRQMCQYLADQGAPVAGVFHCPHHPKGKVPQYAIDCACRKPQPGLILQAIEQLGLDPAASLMVGDKLSDMQAARAAGVGRSYLVTGKEGEEASTEEAASLEGIFDSLAQCVDAVLAHAAAPLAQPTSSL